jgi:hypothetical protein
VAASDECTFRRHLYLAGACVSDPCEHRFAARYFGRERLEAMIVD